MATAVQVESIWNGLTDNSGQPLAAGKVYTYSAGTTTPVSLYTSSDKSTSATNPLILDGNGKAQVWADGRYKFVVKTSADVTLYTLDNLLYGFDDTTVLLGGISTGSANAQTVSVPATVESYANGQRITFIAGYTNSGAVTLQFNALSPISIVKGPSPSSLQAGDLLAGQLYSCTYYGGSFRLENVPTPADVQRSRAQLIASIAGINTITGTLAPALTGYETGEVFRFKAANASTAAVTINIDGLGAKAIQYNNAALVAGEIAANVWHEIVYDGTQFQLLNPINVSAPLWGGTTAGTSTAYTITPAPAITAYAAGQRFTFKAHAANGAAPTLAVSGLTAKTLQRQGTALVGAEFIANDIISVVYDGTNFQVLNLAIAPIFADRTNNRVGIGTTAPTSSLTTIGNSLLAPNISNTAADTYYEARVTGTADGSPNFIRVGVDGASLNGVAYIDARNVGVSAATPLTFRNNGTERMRITSAGRVGIGATTPAAYVQIVNSEAAALATLDVKSNVAGDVATFGAAITKTDATNGTTQRFLGFQISGGATGSGQINANGASQAAFGSYSDVRLKENITDLPSQLVNIMTLRPVEFDYKDGSGHQIGFIAQEVEDIYPDLIGDDGNGYLTLSGLGKNEARMIKAFQEFAQVTQGTIAALAARVAALEA